MGDSIIDRDPIRQKEFGRTLENFEENMRRSCNHLKDYIYDAGNVIKSGNAKRALENILDLISEIESELPGISEFGSKQKKLANYIQDAEDYVFTRR